MSAAVPTSCTMFARRNRPQGTRRDVDLAAFVREPLVTDADKLTLPLFSPAVFRDDYRSGENVIEAFALGFDLDQGNATPDVIELAFVGMRTVYYSSARHSAAAPRGRALVLLSRGVGPKLYRGLWGLVRERAEQQGLPIAREACDASRGWFVPTHRPGAPYYCGTVEAEPLDVDRAVLVLAAREEQRRARQRVESARTTFGSRYIEAALRRSWEDVARSGEGARNNALNRAAYSLARLPLPHSTIQSVLTDAARVAGLPAGEAEKTIASALRARKAS